LNGPGYTIFKLGWSTYNNNEVYSVGIGFGGIVTIAEKHRVSIDLSANQIMYSDDWNWEEDNRIIDRQGFENLAGSCRKKQYFIQSEFLVMK
jgi:hypothetical protein